MDILTGVLPEGYDHVDETYGEVIETSHSYIFSPDRRYTVKERKYTISKDNVTDTVQLLRWLAHLTNKSKIHPWTLHNFIVAATTNFERYKGNSITDK